ncbi:MAG TPA: hypothetical protein VGP43_12245 [Chitinophagaceae bacterium]|nr:hypothetical protein [Chitinophagaceae bacterium]
MKSLFIIIVFIGSGYTTCKQTAANKPIRGKLIFRSCASTVIQVLDSAYYKITQSTWQQSPGTPVYKHVFAAANPCLLSSVAVGSELNFVMAEEKKNDCIVCAMYDNPPAIKHLIKPVK